MPSDFWKVLARTNYLDYRKIRTLRAGRKSAKMIAAINALDSRFAVRGQLPPNVQSQNIVQTVRDLKASRAEENRLLATGKLQAFLDADAISLKEELDLFASYVLSVGPAGMKWVPGPLKKIEKAMSKTAVDYGYAWGQNKDLVRGTFVTNTNEALANVASLIMRTCVLQYGMFLIKKDQQKSVRDGGESTAGYSGWNFAVQFKEHTAFAAEMQANTFDMMYGKMSKESFCRIFDVTESDYAARQRTLQFPGGLGHALYDIQDTVRSGATREEGDLARVLSLDYNDACRGQFRQTTLVELNHRIAGFGLQLTTGAAKNLWREGVEHAAWNGYQIALPPP